MSTANATTPPLTVPTGAADRRPVSEREARRGTNSAQERATYDGVTWLHRPEAEGLLRLVRRTAWAAPEDQGWERVKHNARREVWRAEIGGATYYLKYYLRDPWLRRLRNVFRGHPCNAEWDAACFTERHGIAAPRAVACTSHLPRGGGACAVLITAAITPAESLSSFWLRLATDDDPVRRRRDTAHLLDLLAEMIARAHQAGFEHLDMHVDNILVRPVAPRQYQTVFVDLQTARRNVPIRDGAIVRNLAQLNQWFRRHASLSDRLRFLRAYLRYRNEFEVLYEHGRPLALSFRELVTALQVMARHHAERLWARRDRRAGRDGRYFCRLRLPGGWRGLALTCCKHSADESRASQLVFERRWWRTQLADPLRWFRTQEGSARCKNSHSAEILRTSLPHPDGEIPVIIKHPRARNWRRRMAQWRPISRSRRAWRMGQALLNREIPTARPLALIERRIGPLAVDSVLVTEAVAQAVDLETFLRRAGGLLRGTAWYRLKYDLMVIVARELRRLHERGFRHRDCKASNLLVVNEPELQICWIDLDGIRIGRVPREDQPRPRNHELRAIARLAASLEPLGLVTRADAARFLREYSAQFGAARTTWRGIWHAVAAAVARKRAAKEARRQWKLRHYGRE
ncbi:MAG: hypothetical protein IPM18_14745 [Phycisphaerales bacterium]|nr:hypothetical protein [Phycisphaerales bacterium]